MLRLSIVPITLERSQACDTCSDQQLPTPHLFWWPATTSSGVFNELLVEIERFFPWIFQLFLLWPQASLSVSLLPLQANMLWWQHISIWRGKLAISWFKPTSRASWPSFCLKSPSGWTENRSLLAPCSVSAVLRFHSISAMFQWIMKSNCSQFKTILSHRWMMKPHK